MRFQQLVFRTTPHSLVEWLDEELEKRSIDCVYTHCILSILQEDSLDFDPDEFFDARNNQQKVYQKYGGPESLFSATKSKHQKWKTYSKQILLTGSISCSDIGISDLERKNRNAAINCLKSVSEDNTIEELIEEVCLKLKNLKNINAIEKKDSVKDSNYIESDTAFYIPPSSPTDQVEKYFAAFPPLSSEENYLSTEFNYVNAWFKNFQKNKNIVQDILKKSHISSEFSNNKIETFSSLKSIENLYQPDNKSKWLKIHNKQDNSNLKFSDENSFNEVSVKSNLIDANTSALTNMLSKFKKEHSNDTSSRKPKSMTGLVVTDLRCKKCDYQPNCKCDIFFHNCMVEGIAKSIFDVELTSSTSENIDVKKKEIGPTFKLCTCPKNEDMSISDLCHMKSLLEEFPKPVVSSTENAENVKNQECLSSCKKKSSQRKKNKYKNSNSLLNKEFFGNESIDSICENVDVKLYSENEKASFNNAVTCLKTKEKKSLSKNSCSTSKNDSNLLMSSNIEKVSENKEVEINYADVGKKNSTNKLPKIALKQLKTNAKKNKKSRLKKCSIEQKKLVKNLSSKKDYIFNKEGLESNEKVAVTKVQLSIKDTLEFVGNDCKDTLNVSKYNVKNANNTKGEIYLHKHSLEESKLYISENTEVEVSSVKNPHNKSKTIQIDENTLKSNSGLNCSPASNKIPQHELMFSFEKINLIVIDSNIYYNFDPLKALSSFAENEIFNIFTIGDVNQVNNFLSQFSIPHYRLVNAAQGIDTESEQEASNYFPPSQEMLTTFDNFDTRKNIDQEHLLKITPPCSTPKIYCSKLPTSFSFKDIRSKESGDVYALPNKYCDEITNDNTSLNVLDSRYFSNNDFSEEIFKNRPCFSQNNYSDAAYSSLFVRDPVTVKSISGGRFNKKTCDEDIFYSPKDTIVKTISDAKACSAFKPACKVKQNFMPASSRKDSQKMLRKAINIDRMIQKINGKNRVSSFKQLQNLSLLDYSNVYGQIPSDPISSLDLTNYSDIKIGTENFILTDSDWSEQKNVSLKSIWEPNMNIDRIWRSPTEDEKKINESVSTDLKKDKFHEEFEKEQDELLRDLFSVLHLNEETEEIYSYEQTTQNPIFECSYKTNTDLTEESFEKEKYLEICHILPVETNKFSKGNNKLNSEHSSDPVGIFSLDNCKSNAANFQISCSEENYIKNESYQESDDFALSALKGPYDSFSENRSNIECGGWSLDSDSSILKSEEIQDQSYSLQDLNSTGTLNDDFLYTPTDKHQFSFEDDEITRSESRWPTGFMRRRLKYKSFKRPCAFYMEGHCNRPDCRFAHNLSSITCRFWEDGSCFKGSTCPFLHGYPEEMKTDQHRSFPKYNPKYNYSLDSESDFPSLSPPKTEKPVVVKSEPVDIIRAKGFRNSRQTNH